MTIGDLPRLEFADPGPVRDQVVAAILTGAKTTTSGLALEYERSGREPDFTVADDTAVPAQRFQLVSASRGQPGPAALEPAQGRRRAVC